MTRLLLVCLILAAVVGAPVAASACAVPPRHPTAADRERAATREGEMWRTAPLVYLAEVVEVGQDGLPVPLSPTLLLKGDDLPSTVIIPGGRSRCPVFFGPRMAVGDLYVVYAFPATPAVAAWAFFARADGLGDPLSREAVAAARGRQVR